MVTSSPSWKPALGSENQQVTTTKINNVSSSDIFLEVDVHCDVLRKWGMGQKETKSLREIQSWSRRPQAETSLRFSSIDIILKVVVHCDVLRKLDMGQKETKRLREV